MKEIKAKELFKLLENGILKNTNQGYVNQKGHVVGHSNTVHKIYIEDKYVNMAKSL